MASGSFESSTGTNLEIGCEWTSTANAASNSSSVRVKVYLKHYQIYCAALSGSYVTVGDSTHYFSAAVSSSEGGLQKTYVADETFSVPHSSDGSKNVSISAGYVFNGTYNGHYIGTLSVSRSVTLDKIARASDFTCPSSVTLGTQALFTVSPASSGYTHRVVMTLGSATASGTKSSSKTINYTPPASLADGLTSSMRGQGTVKVETYSGSTKIGEVSKSCTFIIPRTSEYLPDFTLTFTPMSSCTLVTSAGIVAAGLSNGTVTVTGDTAKHGATVSSCVVTYGTRKSTTKTLSLGALKAGNYTYSATVTDSRGAAKTKSGSVTVLPYAEPYASDVSVFRCDRNGDVDDAGAYLSVTATAVASDLGGINSASMVLSVKVRGSTAHTDTAITSGVTTVVPSSLSATSSYEATITVTDTAGSSTTHRTIVPTSHVDLHMKRGKVRFGGYAERAGLECDFPAYFGGGVYIDDEPISDVVVAEGTSGIWTWRKWASGVSECFGTTASKTYVLSAAYGPLYLSSESAGVDTNSVAYPTGLFVSPPTVIATPSRVNKAVLISPRSTGTKDASPDYYIIYYTAPQGGVECALHLSCRGRWKV